MSRLGATGACRVVHDGRCTACARGRRVSLDPESPWPRPREASTGRSICSMLKATGLWFTAHSRTGQRLVNALTPKHRPEPRIRSGFASHSGLSPAAERYCPPADGHSSPERSCGPRNRPGQRGCCGTGVRQWRAAQVDGVVVRGDDGLDRILHRPSATGANCETNASTPKDACGSRFVAGIASGRVASRRQPLV